MGGPIRIAVLLLGAPATGVAASEPAELAFSIGYTAPDACPSGAEFEQAVVTRAKRARVVERNEATLALDAEIVERSEAFLAVLSVTLPDGSHSRREASSQSCSEAAVALAVIAALAIDGYRETVERHEQAPSDDSPATNSVAADTAPKEPLRQRPSRRDTGSRRPPAPTKADTSTGPDPGLFAAGAWESAVAPLAPLGLLAGAELAFRGAGLWQPSVRLGLLYTLTATETKAGGTAEFRVIAGRLSGCPVRWGAARSPSIHGCVEFDAGALHASASGPDVSRAGPQTMAWLAFGPAARGQWPLVDWLSVEATAGLKALAVHNRFVFRPSTLVYDVPLLSLGFGLGVGGHLPP
jgi:hypothetical protein